MSLTLNRFTSGMTDYIAKHNSNASDIESAFNPLSQDVEALKAAGAPGADLDFRLIATNLLINGGFWWWQRGNSERPDAWKIENQSASFTVSRSRETKLNDYSAKTENTGQIVQGLHRDVISAIDSTSTFTFGIYVKTDVSDQARIGVYDGMTTQYSIYHSGGDEWEKLTKTVSFTSAPSELKFILDANGGTVYWNSAILIRGNPSAGPIFIANDYTLEQLRVLSLYETNTTNIRGVGFLNDGDRELETRIEFMAPKRNVPIVSIDTELTGYDFLPTNISKYGFNLLVGDIGGTSGTDGFEVEDIEWVAEVL